MLGSNDTLTGHRIHVGPRRPDIETRAGAPGDRGGTLAEGRPVDGFRGAHDRVRPHAVRGGQGTPCLVPDGHRPQPRWVRHVSLSLCYGVLIGVAATVVTLLALQTVESWAIAPVIGVLAGAMGWLAADAWWGPRPPGDGPAPRW